MSDYLICGTKGSGKSLVGAIFAEQRAKRGLKVVSNVHFFLERFNDFDERSEFLLLPQVPSHFHLSEQSIGLGFETESGVYTDEYAALLLLDEVSNILQAREWQGGGRAELIQIIIHLRKKMYETVYVTHGIDVLDAQVRKYHIDKTVRVTSFKNVFSYAKKWMPDMHTIRFYEGGEMKGKPISKRVVWSPVHFQKLYQTNQVFSLEDDILTLDFSFSIDYASPFLIQDRSVQNSGRVLVDMRVVREMISPKYVEMFPQRPPHVNLNTPFRYTMGVIFLFLSIFWKPLGFLIGGLFLYWMFSPVIYSLTGSITGHKDDVDTTAVVQQEESIATSILPTLPGSEPKPELKCDIFSKRIDLPNTDVLLEYFKQYQFSITGVFSQLGRPNYIITFYDASDSPVAQFSSFEVAYMGWESFYFNQGRGVAIFSEALNVTYLYPIENIGSSGFQAVSHGR